MISLFHNGVFSLLYIIDTANHNIAHQYRSRIGDLDGLVFHHSLGKHECPQDNDSYHHYAKRTTEFTHDARATAFKNSLDCGKRL